MKKILFGLLILILVFLYIAFIYGIKDKKEKEEQKGGTKKPENTEITNNDIEEYVHYTNKEWQVTDKIFIKLEMQNGALKETKQNISIQGIDEEVSYFVIGELSNMMGASYILVLTQNKNIYIGEILWNSIPKEIQFQKIKLKHKIKDITYTDRISIVLENGEIHALESQSDTYFLDALDRRKIKEHFGGQWASTTVFSDHTIGQYYCMNDASSVCNLEDKDSQYRFDKVKYQGKEIKIKKAYVTTYIEKESDYHVYVVSDDNYLYELYANGEENSISRVKDSFIQEINSNYATESNHSYFGREGKEDFVRASITFANGEHLEIKNIEEILVLE